MSRAVVIDQHEIRVRAEYAAAGLDDDFKPMFDEMLAACQAIAERYRSTQVDIFLNDKWTDWRVVAS